MIRGRLCPSRELIKSVEAARNWSVWIYNGQSTESGPRAGPTRAREGEGAGTGTGP